VTGSFMTGQILSLALPLAVFAAVATWLIRLLGRRNGKR
jgi:hypothetical protein